MNENQKKRGSSKKWMLLFGAIVLLTAIWFVYEELVEAFDERIIGIDDLRVGDCFNAVESSKTTTDEGSKYYGKVLRDSCAEPHTDEVYAITWIAAGSLTEFPGEDVLLEAGSDYCTGIFYPMLGQDYGDSQYYATRWVPGELDWRSGTGWVLCTISAQDGPLLSHAALTVPTWPAANEAPALNAPQVLPISALQFGSCYSTIDALEHSHLEAQVLLQVCSQPHDFQVYRVLPLLFWPPEADYLGQEALQTMAVDYCYGNFYAVMGESYELSQWDFDTTYPTEEQWQKGLRQIQCALTSMDDAPLRQNLLRSRYQRPWTEPVQRP